MKKKLYILLIILWLGFIFYMSHQSLDELNQNKEPDGKQSDIFP